MTPRPAAAVDSPASLFDGETLAGWHAVPRLPTPLGPGLPPRVGEADLAHARLATEHQSRWSVEDGAIVGRHTPGDMGYGGYLVSGSVFGDFELDIEVNLDWPADSGVLVRSAPTGSVGYQVLLDHRRSGGLGGFYGNGIGGFHAVEFTIDAEYDTHGEPVGIVAEDPATSLEPATRDKRQLLDRAASASDVLRAWRWGDWNHVRIRCEGRHPTLTTWINDQFVAELRTSRLPAERYDRHGVEDLLPPVGHIALEVHDLDLDPFHPLGAGAGPQLGTARWGQAARCRWRSIEVTDI